jgi:hypothetical protein
VWFDVKAQRGLNYYRIVSKGDVSKPIYVVNNEAYEKSDVEFEYYDITGKKTNIQKGLVIRKSPVDSHLIMAD